MKNNKTPGTDGLNTEFYKFFWGKIKELVYECFQFSLENEILSIDQRRSILTLLPKDGKDVRYLKNWRPLSILNTDYKVLTKLLANRLQSVIKNIVNEDQVGYIKGRQLTQNCRKILDIFEDTADKIDPGMAVFLDFEKAFDTIDHSFMFNALASYNLGPVFCKWIEIIYKKPSTCVINNGYASKPIEINRGIRQGCPISALLFVLVAEVLSIQIRNDIDIKGIKIRDTTITISQMADDTTLFLSNLESMGKCLEKLNHFQNCAGLKLNKEKSKAIQLGINTKRYNTNFGVSWNEPVVKVTGILVGKNMKTIEKDTLENKLTRVKNLLNLWKIHNLTIKGKITVIKSQVMPILLYIAAIYPIPEEFIKKVDKLFFDFIWPSGKHHVKKNMLIKDIESGGLDMPDFECFVKAIKLSWLNRIIANKSSYIGFVSSVIGIPDIEEFMSYKNDLKFISQEMPDFYRQLFKFWFELHSRPPDNANEVLNESLFNNKALLINKKPFFNKSWQLGGVKKIHDIIDNNGKFLTKESLELKTGLTVAIMTYNCIKSAVPRSWSSMITNDAMFNFKVINPLDVKIETQYCNLQHQIKNKMFYKELVNRKTKEIVNTASIKWEEYLYYYDFDWKEIRTLPFKITRETELQSLQFRILNRYIACKDSLFKWGKAENNNCIACKKRETMEHMLYECKQAEQFWTNIAELWFSCYEVFFRLSLPDVIFGIIDCEQSESFKVLNYLILHGKKFIYDNHINNSLYTIQRFIPYVTECLQVEKYVLTIKGKSEIFDKRWLPIYQLLCKRKQ